MKPHMTLAEQELLIAFMRCANDYLEFGSGGSTGLACQTVARSVASVDSSAEWHAAVRDECGNAPIVPELIHVDIGPTGAWGHPLDEARKADWPRYYRMTRTADLILIDGRFRVACFVTAALGHPVGTPLLVHDADRAAYQPIFKIGHQIARAGSMVAFVRRASMSDDAFNILRDHQLDPR